MGSNFRFSYRNYTISKHLIYPKERIERNTIIPSYAHIHMSEFNALSVHCMRWNVYCYPRESLLYFWTESNSSTLNGLALLWVVSVVTCEYGFISVCVCSMKSMEMQLHVQEEDGTTTIITTISTTGNKAERLVTLSRHFYFSCVYVCVFFLLVLRLFYALALVLFSWSRVCQQNIVACIWNHGPGFYECMSSYDALPLHLLCW